MYGKTYRVFEVLNTIPFGIGTSFSLPSFPIGEADNIATICSPCLSLHLLIVEFVCAGVAASTRVGNAIGRRDAAGAKFIGHLSALLSALAGAFVMLSLLASKNVRPSQTKMRKKKVAPDLNHFPKVFGYLYSEDESVVRLVAQVMPFVASFQVADGLAGSCGGVLRGLGRQHLGAAFNILAYYILALPLGVTLAFRGGYGLQGLWMGAFHLAFAFVSRS